MSNTAIKFENISKQYRLGTYGTGTLSNDLKRWWIINIQGLEDPYIKIGQVNESSAKATGDFVWALRDINLEVKQGEVLGIIGKNGAGKSTLLKILSRVTTPTTGRISAKGRIASLLEVGTGFHQEMTGRENIFMNGSILGMTKAEIRRKMDEIIDFAGVEKYIDTPVKRYSSGMTVRLGFAIAAYLEPEILVVDEVLAVGDAEFQKKAIGKMQDVSKSEGRTVLFVSHNMSSISSLCQQGIYLRNGFIRYGGSIQNTISKYLTEETSIKTKTYWDENERPGDDVASLISARLIDENNHDILTVDIHTKIGVEYIYEVKIAGESRIPNIHVFTSRGDCAFISGESDHVKLRGKGIFKTVLWIPANLLNVETYIIGIALSTMSPVIVHFYERDAFIIDVVEDLNYRNNDYNQVIPGVLRPLLNWQTTIIDK
jgi:lipopolysaccharide transport system ATP-binding protein